MTEEITILKTIETDFLVAKLRSDNVVHIHIKANTLITVEMQDKM